MDDGYRLHYSHFSIVQDEFTLKLLGVGGLEEEFGLFDVFTPFQVLQIKKHTLI